MSEQPIGVFDSGVGGISIWMQLHELLPNENTIYLADSLNAPYGEKSREAIIGLSRKNTDYLLSRGCKLIVVACNTATTNAIKTLRELYKVPFIGIEPAIKPAALNSHSKTIGVLATKGTLGSQLFHSTAKLHAGGIRIIEQEGSGLVELIEAGKENTPQMRTLLTGYLNPMVSAQIDHLVLGCTHYPFLIPLLRELLPPTVTIIDSGEAVARQTRKILEEKAMLNSSHADPRCEFYSNADKGVLQSILEKSKESFQVRTLDF
jgi:glutamate racemase